MSGADDSTGMPRAGTPQPSWLSRPCPSWCTRQHAEDDHPEDRYHQSEPTITAAVAGTGDAVPVTATLHPVSVAVRMGQYASDDLPWLIIEPLEGRPYLALTPASARALARALEEQVRSLGQDGE